MTTDHASERAPRRRRKGRRFEVRATDSPITCEALRGLDVERLPYAVWDNQRGFALGEFVAACSSEQVAREIADALEHVR
jgi:hypothetical protein